MELRFIFIICILILFSCSGNPSSDEEIIENLDPHYSAIPDSETDMQSELSEADKKKLAEANGVEAETISLAVLNANLQNLKSTTALCYFWSATQENSNSAFKNLKQISSQTASEKLEVIIVHMEAGDHKEKMNATIREHGIDADAYILKDEAGMLDKLIGTEEKSNIELPSYYVYNKEDGTGIWIDGQTDYAELYVMIQPFIM